MRPTLLSILIAPFVCKAKMRFLQTHIAVLYYAFLPLNSYYGVATTYDSYAYLVGISLSELGCLYRHMSCIK